MNRSPHVEATLAELRRQLTEASKARRAKEQAAYDEQRQATADARRSREPS